MKLNWTEPKPPTKGISYYDHVELDTPLGTIMIEWKSWKDSPDYGVEIRDYYIGTAYSLEEAKDIAEHYLHLKYRELKEFLK